MWERRSHAFPPHYTTAGKPQGPRQLEYVQGTKTVYYLLYKIEGILSTVHKMVYFMNNMLTSHDNVLPVKILFFFLDLHYYLLINV